VGSVAEQIWREGGRRVSKRGNASARRKSDEGRGFLSKENCVLCEPAENAGSREKRGAVWSEKGGVDSGVFESVSSIKK